MTPTRPEPTCAPPDGLEPWSHHWFELNDVQVVCRLHFDGEWQIPGLMHDEPWERLRQIGYRYLGPVAPFAPVRPHEPAGPGGEVTLDDIAEAIAEPSGDYLYGLRCGLEDRQITDRYEAAEYGWQQAFEYVASALPKGVALRAGPAQPPADASRIAGAEAVREAAVRLRKAAADLLPFANNWATHMNRPAISTHVKNALVLLQEIPETALALPPSAGPAGTWRDIASAPKDGSEFIAWCPLDLASHGLWGRLIVRWFDGWQPDDPTAGWFTSATMPVVPMLWASLPPPPVTP